MKKDPPGVELRKRAAFLARPEGRNKAEEETEWKDEDTKGDGAVSPVDEDKGKREDESEKREGLVGIDRKPVVSGV